MAKEVTTMNEAHFYLVPANPYCPGKWLLSEIAVAITSTLYCIV